MRIILTSNLSIKNELKKIALLKNILVEENIALDIQKINLDRPAYEDYIRNVDNIIFQSKNAVVYSDILHGYILHNKTAKLYCMGKFTATELKKYFTNKIIYPKENYSSESLMKIIKNEKVGDESYLVIKGEDGRDYIQSEIKKFSIKIKVIDVYKRVPLEGFLKQSSIDNKANNYIIVSSKSALDVLLLSLSKYKKLGPLILIIPNERIIRDVNKQIFKEIIIICNSSDAKTYLTAIEKHNEES